MKPRHLIVATVAVALVPTLAMASGEGQSCSAASVTRR